MTVAALRIRCGVTVDRDWNIKEAGPGPKQPNKLPVVPSREEVAHFPDCVGSPAHHAILPTYRALGLRHDCQCPMNDDIGVA